MTEKEKEVYDGISIMLWPNCLPKRARATWIPVLLQLAPLIFVEKAL